MTHSERNDGTSSPRVGLSNRSASPPSPYAASSMSPSSGTTTFAPVLYVAMWSGYVMHTFGVVCVAIFVITSL